MKTAGRENPNRYRTVLIAFRVHGTEAENTSCSMAGPDVEKKYAHRRSVFFLTPFIEPYQDYFSYSKNESPKWPSVNVLATYADKAVDVLEYGS